MEFRIQNKVNHIVSEKIENDDLLNKLTGAGIMALAPKSLEYLGEYLPSFNISEPMRATASLGLPMSATSALSMPIRQFNATTPILSALIYLIARACFTKLESSIKTCLNQCGIKPNKSVMHHISTGGSLLLTGLITFAYLTDQTSFAGQSVAFAVIASWAATRMVFR